MAMKESSDEFNPLVITADPVLTLPRAERSTRDYIALVIATCGVGYLPLAPGTWGSLVGIGLYALLRKSIIRVLFSSGLGDRWQPILAYALATWELLAITCVALVGVWAATRTEKLSGTKDPGKVVIDEVAGQMIALVPLGFEIRSGWWNVLVAFLLFRLFDIIKPYPCKHLEKLPSGLGIMADDIVAGIYAALGVAVLVMIQWSF